MSEETDVQGLVDEETRLARVEREKAEAMKSFREQITAIKQRISVYVRRLNGEDPQGELEV